MGPIFNGSEAPDFAKGPGVPGLVSVVIPTYNRAHIVTRAIDSVLAQTYRPVEVLVVDDGSTDDTAVIVRRYSPEVRYFSQLHAGVSAVRNLGLKEARGEFIALLDSDDSWENWKLQAQVSIFRALPQVGMVWNGTGQVVASRHLRKMYSAYDTVKIEDMCSVAGRLCGFWPSAPAQIAVGTVYAGNIFPHMLLGNLVHTSTVLLRHERLRATGLFDMDLRNAGEDYEFHFRTSSHGPVAVLDAPSIRYRVGSADQSGLRGRDRPKPGRLRRNPHHMDVQILTLLSSPSGARLLRNVVTAVTWPPMAANLMTAERLLLPWTRNGPR